MKKSKKRIIAALIAALSLTVISGGIINASAKEKETVEVEELVSRSELFIENNSKQIKTIKK